MRTLVLTGLLLASVVTGFLMGTSHSASYAAKPVQYQYNLQPLGPISACQHPNGDVNPASGTKCYNVRQNFVDLGSKGWRLVTVVDGVAVFMAP